MKIIIHWDRVFGLLIAIIVVFIAIICFKLINKSNQFNQQNIGQCDMNKAQKIIDNLVRSFFFFLLI
jgi:Trk-type K+ transport system membrane component